MSSLSAKDRVSLCMFTFADGRRCRTPRISSHPHFCFYHAKKEARARTAETLGSPSTNIVRPSAPMPGANPSATPSTATTTTASRPPLPPNRPPIRLRM